MSEERFYETPDGRKFPLHEAPYKYSITVYKSDCRKAQIGDPMGCLIALGAKRDKMIQEAYIGSARDAYLIFKGHRHSKPYALHFTMSTSGGRVRDFFDTHKAIKTQTIELLAPSKGRTLAARARSNKARREAIKNGAPVATRGTPNKSRVMRIGVPHRPRAVIGTESVTIPPKDAP